MRANNSCFLLKTISLIALVLLTACTGGKQSTSSVDSSIEQSSLQRSSLAQSSQESSIGSSQANSLSSANNSHASSSYAANQKPSLTITYPKQGQLLPHLSHVDVVVSAMDNDGSIASVLLLLNNQRLAVINQPPYIWPARLLPSLSNMPEGNHTLQAIATDNQGANQSTTIDFAISGPNNFPNLSFVTPGNGLTLPIDSSLDVNLNASDTDGTITSVSLWVDDIFVSDITTAPFQWLAQSTPALTQLAAGTYTLKATATDDQNGQITLTRTILISQFAPQDAGDPAQGKKQYRVNCLNCHGQFGQGVATNPALLPVKNSYSIQNNEALDNLSLTQLISQLMPIVAPEACTDQCARNIASYLTQQLGVENTEHGAITPNAINGQTAYALHCASCHGEAAQGTNQAPVLLPIRTTHNYNLKTFNYFAQTSAFTMIDIGMPLAANRYPEGQAHNCSGQCAADVLAYLTTLTQALTPDEQKQLQIARGKTHYQQSCSRCHGEDGTFGGSFGITQIIPLSDEYQNNNTLDETDAFYRLNRDTMPPKTPEKCEEQCAKDVSVYIREILN